jgi:PKHD-type hydroxylase
MLYPVKPRISPGKDVTAYWENFLSDEDIAYILNDHNWSKTSPASIGGSSGNNSINTSVRSTEVGWLNPCPENMHIWDKISDAASKVNSQFFKFDLTGFYEPIQLGVYRAENNGHYNWHTDATHTDATTARKLSMVLMLSDPSEFEGGELQVKPYNDNIQTLELKKGRAWFFPSYVIHRVTPVTKGVRKSLVAWVGGPEFK